MKNKKTKAVVSFLFLSCLALLSSSFVSAPDRIEVFNKIIAGEKPSISPVDLAKAKIGDGFGFRIHPATKTNKMHNGIDFMLPEGESVMATASGEVVDVGSDKDRGTYVNIKHDEVYTTTYSHLKSAVVKIGDIITKKQLVGYVGSTGKTSSEPHLHYEVLKEGKHVNPIDYLPKAVAAKLPASKP